MESWIPDNSDVSLARDEFTIAQLVKPLGDRTAVIGKWHLNGGLHLEDQPQYLINMLQDRYEVHNLTQRELDRVRTIRQKFDIYRASVEG